MAEDQNDGDWIEHRGAVLERLRDLKARAEKTDACVVDIKLSLVEMRTKLSNYAAFAIATVSILAPVLNNVLRIFFPDK